MSPAAETFELHRGRLLGIAMRMVGSKCEAEDLVQDAYLRWHHSAKEDIQSPAAWLVTITTRLCLDRLRNRKQERVEEPASSTADAAFEAALETPESQREFAEDVADAFRMVLERLKHEERVVFLLHDVFDYDYAELEQMLGKSEPSCRQVIRRARLRLREPMPRFTVATASHERLFGDFLAALASQDRGHIHALLVDGDRPAADRGRQPMVVLEDPIDPVDSDHVDADWQSTPHWRIESIPGGATCHNNRPNAVL